MQNNNREKGPIPPKKKGIKEDVGEIVSTAYTTVANWVRPKKGQPIILQIAIFILKLPVLLLLLMFSPVLLILLLLIFLIAL